MVRTSVILNFLLKHPFFYKMKKIFATIFFLLAACAVIFWFLWPELKKPKPKTVNSFEECARAGYFVFESYPRQCNAPNGQIFLETIMEDK